MRKTLIIGLLASIAIAFVAGDGHAAEGTDMKAASTAFYVSPTGDDKNDGSKGEPFATLEQARDAIRAMDREARAKGVTVRLATGAYAQEKSFELDGRDSGTKEGPIVYRADEGATVSVMGGRTIAPAAFTPVTDKGILERLEPSARDKVMQCDLRKMGITEYGQIDSLRRLDVNNGTFKRREVVVPELWFKDKALPLSVWPNEGWATYGRVIDKGSVPRVGEKPDRPGTLEYIGDRPERWAKAEHIFLQGYFAWDWYDDILEVAKLDTEQKRITFSTPHVYGLKPNKRYRALGLLEEIDQPGEWTIDAKTGTLYIYPPSDFDGGTIVMSTVSSPLIQLTGTRFITLRDLTVETTQGTGIDIAGGTDNLIDGCTIRNTGDAGVVIRPMSDTPSDPGLLHAFPQDSGDIIKDGRRNGVKNSELYGIGSTGIVLLGGDRKTLAPGGHYVVNTEIHHYARIKRANQPAININGVGQRVANNFIHDAPHVGIFYSGNDHVIEYNEFTRLCEETSDVGVIYSGRDWTYRGNVVRYNFIHHIKNTGGHGSSAVYLDDSHSSTHIYGNVMYKVHRAVLIGGGRDNIFENNVIVDSGLAVHIDNRSEGWARKYQVPGGDHRMYEKLEAVNHDQPPHSTRYPELARLLDENPHKPLGNQVRNNISVRTKWINGPAHYLTVGDNLVTQDDPGFVDAANNDFNLKDIAAIQEKLPGFEAIPFEKIGLRRGEGSSE